MLDFDSVGKGCAEALLMGVKVLVGDEYWTFVDPYCEESYAFAVLYGV